MDTGKLLNTPSLTLVQHLEELRRRILWSLAAVGFGAAAGYALSDRMLDGLLRPLVDAAGGVYFFSPADALWVRLQLSLLAGILFAMPVVAVQAWMFVAPGLHAGEKKWIPLLVAVTSGLFLAGATFAYGIVLPAAVRILMGMRPDVLEPMISVVEYVRFLTTLVLGFGVAFNLPVFVLALAWAGIVKGSTLRKYRRHAVVCLFIAAALLTPGPDVVSQFLLAAPLVVLFELSLWGAVFLDRARHQNVGGPTARTNPKA